MFGEEKLKGVRIMIGQKIYFNILMFYAVDVLV